GGVGLGVRGKRHPSPPGPSLSRGEGGDRAGKPRTPLLPLREKVARPQGETDEGCSCSKHERLNKCGGLGRFQPSPRSSFRHALPESSAMSPRTAPPGPAQALPPPTCISSRPLALSQARPAS